MNVSSKAESFGHTKYGIVRIFQKESLSRYSFHLRLDTDLPALLLVVVAKFESLIVTDDTISTPKSNLETILKFCII